MTVPLCVSRPRVCNQPTRDRWCPFAFQNGPLFRRHALSSCPTRTGAECQTTVLGRWPDGSIKWLTVTFFDEFVGGENAGGLRLQGQHHPADTALTSTLNLICRKHDNLLSIQTGLASFQLQAGVAQFSHPLMYMDETLGSTGCRLLLKDARGRTRSTPLQGIRRS